MQTVTYGLSCWLLGPRRLLTPTDFHSGCRCATACSLANCYDPSFVYPPISCAYPCSNRSNHEFINSFVHNLQVLRCNQMIRFSLPSGRLIGTPICKPFVINLNSYIRFASCEQKGFRDRYVDYSIYASDQLIQLRPRVRDPFGS
jgi:hypothetical protein